jgi:hypothetical protein
MSERRSAVFVNKNVDNVKKVHPYSSACEICNFYDSFYQCLMCKKQICIHHKMLINDEAYCSSCLNNNELQPYINALHLHENRMTCYKSYKENMKYIFSFEWTRKQKVDPLWG